jgi:hypothetical protein
MKNGNRRFADSESFQKKWNWRFNDFQIFKKTGTVSALFTMNSFICATHK